MIAQPLLQQIGRCEHEAVTYYVYVGESPRRPSALILCALGPGDSYRSTVSFARGLQGRVRRALRQSAAGAVTLFEALLLANARLG
ncbi:MAG: hypothetical protein OER21_08685 [Gemmatimonadota bacterium]|nr:hypothetical protein [Gemmatimonadota bacterium]